MSRSRLRLTFEHVCACKKLTETTSTPSWSGTRSGGTLSKRRRQIVCRILSRWPRDWGPPAVPRASRLFMLPVAARRWVLIDNKYTRSRRSGHFLKRLQLQQKSCSTVRAGAGPILNEAGALPNRAYMILCITCGILWRIFLIWN
jgi:hypothetical protein